MAGCDVVAKYNSADVHMGPASRTGRLRIVSNAVVREVMLSDENRVTGVKYIDRLTKRKARFERKPWLSAAHACKALLCC
jgi:choline dehydrogenase-like flavoprotein